MDILTHSCLHISVATNSLGIKNSKHTGFMIVHRNALMRFSIPDLLAGLWLMPFGRALEVVAGKAQQALWTILQSCVGPLMTTTWICW